MKIKKYDIMISNNTFNSSINRIINQSYKILCYREENKDWEKPLKTVIIEIIGMQRLIQDENNFFVLLSKLEALFNLNETNDFFDFRRTVFECMTLLEGMIVCNQD